jgi:cob(I)alamin adenosyltransferase
MNAWKNSLLPCSGFSGILLPLMARPTISTGKGDGGTAATIAGERISKASPRMHALGDLDELNTILGLVLADEGLSVFLVSGLMGVQKTLFAVGSDVAVSRKKGSRLLLITPAVIRKVERWGAEMEEMLPRLTRFILPGGSRAAALLHHARAICRRAERWVTEFSLKENVNPHVQVYLNRLSDVLFLAARLANKEAGKGEIMI